jgi:hypothetical protein
MGSLYPCCTRDHICSTGEQKSLNGFCQRCWRYSKSGRAAHPFLHHKLGRRTKDSARCSAAKTSLKTITVKPPLGVWGSLVSYPLSAVPISSVHRRNARSQRSSAMDSLRLFPRRLCCRQRAGCCVLSHLYLARFAWQTSASGSLRSQICALSQLERASGVMAASLAAEARGPLSCQRCLCTRCVRCRGRETEGMWYETCWR